MTEYSDRILDEVEPEDIERFRDEGLTENPSDYYFAFDDECQLEGEGVVIVTPKKLYDERDEWCDSGYIGFLLKPYLEDKDYLEAMEATFEIPEGTTREEARIYLSSCGFEEKDIFAHL